MTRYIVTWQETHYAEVDAIGEKMAKERAMHLTDEVTLSNVFGETITRMEE